MQRAADQDPTAVWTLCRALDIINLLPEDYMQALCSKLALTNEEMTRWEEMSRKMKVVFQEVREAGRQTALENYRFEVCLPKLAEFYFKELS